MQSIDEFVTGQLAAWEVPGCAVAAVRDGDVVLAAGWGHRDQAAGTPVTKDTLFAIGSVTKAFTVAAVGALVDDGLLEWDRPLQDYLPGLRLHDPIVTGRVTITDLLAHRSGLPRHDLTWIGHPDLSRADLVRRLRFLPLSRDLRQQFQYCNLGYLVAGHLVEALSGMPWEEYTQSRLLTPLGMSRSNLSVGEMLTDPDHATAYERRSRCRGSGAGPAGDRPGARGRHQLQRRPTWPAGCWPSSAAAAPHASRVRPARRPGGHVADHGGAAAHPAHADTRGPDLPRLDQARLRAGLADRPVPRAPGRRARRRHRRVPDRVHAAARRRHRRHRADQHLVERHGTGRRLPGPRRAPRAGAAGLVRGLQAALRRGHGRDARGPQRPPGRRQRRKTQATRRLRRRLRASRLRRAQHHHRRGDPASPGSARWT